MDAATTAGKIAVAGATGRVGSQVVDVLRRQGHEVVPMSRASGVDIVSGDGLREALDGVTCIVDAASGPEAAEEPATAFFTAAATNLQQYGRDADVERIVVVSIIGLERFTAGYMAAKAAHERVHAGGPVPSTVVRASQFHEFVGQLLDWGTQGDVGYVPVMRMQPIAARAVAEVLAEVATGARSVPGPYLEVAGPSETTMGAAGALLAAKRGHPAKVEAVTDQSDPDREAFASGGLLPGPDAILTGPSFEEWLDSQS
jgi:uncharacterized protein YbjT (DUF2867 family)